MSAEEFKRALADAWAAGHHAGEMWGFTEHTNPEYGPDTNPYGGVA